MTEYLITFNDEWVPDHTAEELREKANAARAVLDEMLAEDVLIFTNGGLDRSTAVCSVEPVTASPSSPTARTSRPRSTLAGSPSWTCPTTRRHGTGPAGSRPCWTGPRRCTGSGVPGSSDVTAQRRTELQSRDCSRWVTPPTAPV